MDAGLRVITRLPLQDGSPDAATLEGHRIGRIGAARIRKLLRQEQPWFVIADVGLPLKWIAPSQRFDFWKEEVQPRLIDPQAEVFHVERFPGGYCYLASEWRHCSEAHVNIVLEKQH